MWLVAVISDNAERSCGKIIVAGFHPTHTPAFAMVGRGMGQGHPTGEWDQTQVTGSR